MNAKTALIIGGSGGIGADICRKLAIAGFTIVVHGRNESKINKISEDLIELGAESVHSICRNLENRSDIDNLLVDCEQIADKVDVLVVSFGPLAEFRIEDAEPGDISTMYDLNFLLPSLLVSLFAPAMSQKGGGSIILFGGTGTDSLRAYKKISAYSAAKFGLNSYMRSAASEFSGKGVRINLISPGYVETEYYDQKSLILYKNSDKLLEPRRISDIVEFLISDAASAINGSVINAGGGREW